MYISGVKPSFTILCVRVGDNKLRELAGGNSCSTMERDLFDEMNGRTTPQSEDRGSTYNTISDKLCFRQYYV